MTKTFQFLAIFSQSPYNVDDPAYFILLIVRSTLCVCVCVLVCRERVRERGREWWREGLGLGIKI